MAYISNIVAIPPNNTANPKFKNWVLEKNPDLGKTLQQIRIQFGPGNKRLSEIFQLNLDPEAYFFSMKDTD